MFISGILCPLHYKIVSRVKLNLKQLYFSNMNSLEVQNFMRLVFRKSVLAVNPSELVQRELLVLNNKLHIRDKSYSLKENCYVIGFGKCVFSMAVKVEQILGNHLQKGIISIPYGFLRSNQLDENKFVGNSRVTLYEGAMNNLPDENALVASNEIKNLVETLKDTDILIVLISGGGSSLLTLPKPPISLEEKLDVILKLGGAGANIVEMNTVRKNLSLVKGGGLASLAYPCQTIALILSDVIGDPIDIISSGPTVLNNDDEDAALKVIEKYKLDRKISSSVFQTLKSKVRPIYYSCHVQNVLIGNNRIALEAAARECISFGFSPVIVSDSISGLVSEVTELYIHLICLMSKFLNREISSQDFISEINPLMDKINVKKHIRENIYSYVTGKGIDTDKMCLILGGEPTVRVLGNGCGGRNQELSLRIAVKLYELESNDSILDKCDVVFLSGGTDGIDGPTKAAGAIVYSGQIKQAVINNIDPYDYINRNDSHNFFLRFNNGKDLIITGHTGVNVMDVHVLIVQKKDSLRSL